MGLGLYGITPAFCRWIAPQPILIYNDKMAKDKKSFLLYTDLIHTLEKMSNEKAGELFKHIMRYVNDLDPKTDDLIIDLTFEPIKQQLKRDLKNYENRCLVNKNNGSKGGRPKNPTEPIKTDGLFSEPKKPDNDNDNDNDIDNGNEKEEEPPKGVSFNFKKALLNYGFDSLLVDRWLDVRKKKRANNSDVAFEGFIREVEKTGKDKNEILRRCVEDSWHGFKAHYINKEQTTQETKRRGNDTFDY